jgi:hypothetical protein
MQLSSFQRLKSRVHLIKTNFIGNGVNVKSRQETR